MDMTTPGRTPTHTSQTADHHPRNTARHAAAIGLTATVVTALLLGKSMLDFSHSGPQIQKEVLQSYTAYLVYALARLSGWVFLFTALMAGLGISTYANLGTLFGWRFRWRWALLAAGLGVGLTTTLQFGRMLLVNPGTLMASFSYRPSRLYPLWDLLSPLRLAIFEIALGLLALLPAIVCTIYLLRKKDFKDAAVRTALAVFFGGAIAIAEWHPEPGPALPPAAQQSQPNIVMIGSDSLRADHLGINGYHRDLTPTIDTLAKNGVNFSNCFVPLARTGPSLTSFLTGLWPHTHGIRDNFVGDEEAHLGLPALPALLAQSGYSTAVVGDWAAGDLAKIDFGTQHHDVSPDQWNLKYLLRQGPKDIRLFLSLFTQNRIGKYFLPEIYFLAGAPITDAVGRDARAMIKRLAEAPNPFFLNIFIASTHGPFGSRTPFYTLYADPAYRGESKFALSGLSDPDKVIERQAQDKKHFDVQQLRDLYDGATRSFDEEISRILDYLKNSGLDKNTIVVIYSDHGIDLFEGETWGQGNILSDYSHKVPLVIHDPRSLHGLQIARNIRSIDLAPTLLEMAGLPIPDYIQGSSLLPLITGNSKEPERPVFLETGIWLANVKGLPAERIRYPGIMDLLEIPDKGTGTLAVKKEHLDAVIEAKARSVILGDWQLIYFPLVQGASYALYARDASQQGDRDLMAQHPQKARQLKELLTSWLQQDPERALCNEHVKPKSCTTEFAAHISNN